MKVENDALRVHSSKCTKVKVASPRAELTNVGHIKVYNKSTTSGNGNKLSLLTGTLRESGDDAENVRNVILFTENCHNVDRDGKLSKNTRSKATTSFPYISSLLEMSAAGVYQNLSKHVDLKNDSRKPVC